jgi:hypothetical protein
MDAMFPLLKPEDSIFAIYSPQVAEDNAEDNCAASHESRIESHVDEVEEEARIF